MRLTFIAFEGYEIITQSGEGIPYEFNQQVVEGNNVVETILRAAKGY
jgi:hypothetical protein